VSSLGRDPAGFDASRAVERAADPTAGASPRQSSRRCIASIAERRDIRRFRPDEVPDVLERVLERRTRPVVGSCSRGASCRPRRGHAVAMRSSPARAPAPGDAWRARAAVPRQKIEGIVEAPLGICVCCDPGDPASRCWAAGRSRDDVYSTGARSRTSGSRHARRPRGGLGELLPPDDLRELLGIPRASTRRLPVRGWPTSGRSARSGIRRLGRAARWRASS